jgi:hypothetical protein
MNSVRKRVLRHLRRSLIPHTAPQSDSRSTLTPLALLTQDAQMGAARNVDGCVFLSVPELESDSLQYMERVMGVPVVGLG